MDASGKLQLPSPPDSIGAAKGIVTIVTSPGVPSSLVSDEIDEDALLSIYPGEGQATLFCRGSTLGPLTSATISCLAAASAVSTVVLVEGLTEGDVEGGIADTRHARTLSVLFQSRLSGSISSSSLTPQTLILVVSIADSADWDEDSTSVTLRNEVRLLFDAAAAGMGKTKEKLEDFYTLQVRPVTPLTASKVGPYSPFLPSLYSFSENS